MAATKPALYALLIGINDYHPNSNVGSLDGCVNDAKAMESFLKEFYSDLIPARGIKKLFNEKATRTNVIKAFQNQLIKKAKPGDTVLFFYAGHGSFTKSLEVFKKFDGKVDGKVQDETLVCYDSRVAGHHDLADKELAVLLSRIDKGVDIVVIADSCHSASITRSVLGKPKPKARFHKGPYSERALQDYLLEDDNYYQDLLDTKGAITIPNSRHLLLSGCDRKEVSYETTNEGSGGGMFTTALLKNLRENRDISYSHLFEAVRSEVLNESQGDQRPTMNAWESFNPNTVFLRKDTQPNTRYIVNFKDDAWQMAYGAIYGLPSNPEQAKDLTIGIFENQHPSAELVEQVKVDKVNLGTTILAGLETLEKSNTYWGEIQNFPTALSVNLEGDDETVAAFNKLYKQDPSIFVRLKEGAANAKYTLALTNSTMTISAVETGRIIKETEAVNEVNVVDIKKGLDHIAKWETTASLKNESPKSSLKDALEFTFFQENEDGEMGALEGTDFNLSCESEDGELVPIWYEIKARNVGNGPLYVALLHLGSDFEIQAYFQSQILEKGSDWKVLDTESRGLVLENDDSQITEIFKIIVSNKPFDEQKFLLPKLMNTRKAVTRRLKNQEDWFVHTITVDLVRKENKVGKGDITLLNDKIKIKKHASFEADLSLGTASQKATRSITPWNTLQQRLTQNGVGLLNLAGNTRSVSGGNIIELSNLENPESLKDNPLELNVQQSLADAETLIPVTLNKDGLIIPIGTSEKQADGSIDIKIDQLPTYDDPGRANKTRSLPRAAWFSLLKLARLDTNTYFKLRKVYYRKGVAKRTRLRKSHIRNADKILIVIHGIIGDTKGMIKNLEFLEDAKKYDLILTFDYENLNTKIEDIAKALNERLGDFGLGADDGKTVDILAHSMGGLVSRYMIEFIRKGDNLVDNLFMFGTPNGGSVFGDIPAFRDKLTAILTIGLNYGKLWLGTIGIALDYFNKFLIGTKALTVTLSQMSTEGDFIDQLVNSEVKVQTKYTIIAGDITDYQSLDDAFFSKLMDAILLKIGNVANDDPNDIAVLVEDIRAVPEGIAALKYDACCHHMNYFEEGEGLRILKEVMG